MEFETEIIFGIIVLLIAISGAVYYYIAPIVDFFNAHSILITGTATSLGVGFVNLLIVISFPISVIFIVGIIVSIERIKRIRGRESTLYDAPVEDAIVEPKSGAKGSPETTNRWRKILGYVDSLNENDWRQAIIEADIVLDEMLTKMSYHGDDLGSKLRGATKADFKTLDQAWEAHKVRNDIAHDGSNFLLSQREAKRVINLYRQVFEEFYYI